MSYLTDWKYNTPSPSYPVVAAGGVAILSQPQQQVVDAGHWENALRAIDLLGVVCEWKKGHDESEPLTRLSYYVGDKNQRFCPFTRAQINKGGRMSEPEGVKGLTKGIEQAFRFQPTFAALAQAVRFKCIFGWGPNRLNAEGYPTTDHFNTHYAASALLARFGYVEGRENEGLVTMKFWPRLTAIEGLQEEPEQVLNLPRAALQMQQAIRDAFNFDPGRAMICEVLEELAEGFDSQWDVE